MRLFLVSLCIPIALSALGQSTINPSQVRGTAVVGTPNGTQKITQGPQNPLLVTNLNNTYYAVAYCATPGVYDQTCIQNAITAIANNGLVGPGGFPYGTLVISANTYNISAPIVVPVGVEVAFRGTGKNNLFGTVLNGTSANMTMIQVNADNVSFSEIVFQGQGATGIIGIRLGSDTQTTFDTKLLSCWFQSLSNGVRMHNAAGMEMVSVEMDGNVQYGVYASSSEGDLRASGVTTTAMRMFGNINSFHIDGDATTPANWDGFNLSGRIDYTGHDTAGVTTTAMFFRNIKNLHFDGMTQYNLADVFQLYNVTNANFGPWVSDIDGGSLVNAPNGFASYNVNIHDVTASNPVTAGGKAAFSLNGIMGGSFIGNTTLNPTGSATATYGLTLANGSAKVSVGGNSLNSQVTAPYNIADLTNNTFDVPVLGWFHAPGASTVAMFGQSYADAVNPKVLRIISDPTNNQVMIQGTAQGLADNVDINFQTGGGKLRAAGNPVLLLDPATGSCTSSGQFVTTKDLEGHVIKVATCN